ncbi:MAG: hypothetical protein IKW83_07335 [Muribaculaceae bacterium]|nr:hypothetical protein [Muribaculaceae bacterium]
MKWRVESGGWRVESGGWRVQGGERSLGVVGVLRRKHGVRVASWAKARRAASGKGK